MVIIKGDALNVLKTMLAGSIQCCVTSPPYWELRDYNAKRQLGLEKTPEEYIAKLVEIFREVKRVLRNDGTLWLNLGDTYYHNTKMRMCLGLKNKDLVGIPWMAAFALRNDGWYLRSDIIWSKPNTMPESVKDRPTKAHEYIFLLSKSAKYFYNAKAIAEPTVTRDCTVRDRDTTKLNNTPGRTRMGGLRTNNYESRNKRTVWNIPTQPFKGAHFAVFPEKLVEPCIKAGSKEGVMVLDPFSGAGTVGVVCKKLARDFIGIELKSEYIKLAEKRIDKTII